jgi:hypothetical protein
VAAIGIDSGYCTPAPLSLSTAPERSSNVAGYSVSPAFLNIWSLKIDIRKSFE